jgi:hypothetical protein
MKRIVFMTLMLMGLISMVYAVPRELVIVEIGTGTWCQFCPGAAMGAHDLIVNGHAVGVVKNHNGDSYANTYSNARNAYYGISSFPTAYFDGGNPLEGGSASSSLYNSYLAKVNQCLAVPSKYTISAEGSQTGGNINLTVTVSKPEADSNTNVVLHASLTESHIAHNWFNQTHVDNVNRLMVPNQNGTPISLNTGESTTVDLSFSINPSWVPANLEVVLWLQNVTTKEILQGKKYSYAYLTGAYPASQSEITFPDTYVNGYNSQALTLYNFADYPVTASVAVDNQAFLADVMNLTIPAYQSSTLNVIFLPSMQQTYIGTMTITGNFYNHPSITIPLSGYGFINTEPVATNVSVSGPPVSRQILSGYYEYSDADSHTEGDSTYRWGRMMGNQFQSIANATGITYSIAEQDIGYQLAFEVTPVDQYGMPGTPVVSAPTPVVIALPCPQNFAAQVLPPDTVVLTWQKPVYYDTRGFVGYRLYRNDLNIATITDVNTLTFTDTYVPVGIHEYWIRSMFNNPSLLSDPSPIVTVQIVPVANEDLIISPEASVHVFPNPFSQSTSLLIKSDGSSPVNLKIFNAKGQLLRSWQARTDTGGELSLHWDGKDNSGKEVESGIYMYQLETKSTKTTGRIIRIK